MAVRMPLPGRRDRDRAWRKAVGKARRAVRDVGSTDDRALPGTVRDWTPVGGRVVSSLSMSTAESQRRECADCTRTRLSTKAASRMSASGAGTMPGNDKGPVCMDGRARLYPKIRPATPAAAAVVARIYIDSWNAGFGELMSQANRTVTPELIENWNHDLAQPVPHRWWIAEQMGLFVGVVGIGPSRDPIDPQIGKLDTIAVDPPCWRKGIGKALISLALQHVISDGYREAILWTVEGYERGIAFYEAMRWTRDGGVRDNGRQVRFRRDLTAFQNAAIIRRRKAVAPGRR